MGKVIKYDVNLNELNLAMSERKLGGDELDKLNHSILGGQKLKKELEDAFDPEVDKSVQICLKSHGIYIQSERDLLKKEKIREWTFMVRIPIWGGGSISPNEWLEISRLADLYSSDWQDHPSIRLTTRQSIQFHKVEKKNLLPLVHGLINLERYTLNACGDNTRNPLACVHTSSVFDASKLANRIGSYFRLDANEYYKVFGDTSGKKDERTESFKYEKNGLPRKFKMGIGGYYIDGETREGISCNCTDILTNDIGIAPVIKNNKLEGYQIYVGGGLGQKNGKTTFASLASPFGIFKTEDDLMKGLDAIVNVQQELGDRENRHWARFKNLIVKKGLEHTNLEITDILYNKERFEFVQSKGVECLRELIRKRDIKFDLPINLNLGKLNKHHYWTKQHDGNYSYGFWIETGRITDFANQGKVKSLIDELVEKFRPQIRITPYQDLFFTNIKEEDKISFEEFINKNFINHASTLRKSSLACVGLPTCPLAVSDSERYFHPLFSELEKLQLGKVEGVSIGISGCERHCSRNVRHDISIEGKADALYQLKLMFGKAEENYLAQDIVYEEEKYLKHIPQKDMPALLQLIINNYLNNKNDNKENIAEFHKRIGIKGILDLIKSDKKLSHLLIKTYDPYLV